MVKIVNGLDGLPLRPDIKRSGYTVYHTTQLFLRSKSDPKTLIEYHDGEVYRRADGENWEWPAYVRDRKIKVVDGVRTPEPWSALAGQGAYCDDKKYPPATAKVA